MGRSLKKFSFEDLHHPICPDFLSKEEHDSVYF